MASNKKSSSSSVQKNLSFFFPSKKNTEVLPPSSNEYFKEKLLEESHNSERIDREQNLVKNCDNEDKISELSTKLDAANKEISSVKKIVAKQRDDIKSLKHLVNAANRLCVLKDLKIEQLLKEKGISMHNTTGPLFEKFKDKVDLSVLNQLRRIQKGQKYDSTFVLTLMRHLYASDLNVLLTKTAVGSGKSKIAVSPAKTSIIHQMFRERIVSEEDDQIQIELRVNRISSLINDAIFNIVRPLKRVIIHKLRF